MNEDKWQRTVAKRRKARRQERRLGCLLLIALILLAAAGIGGYFYYKHTHSPEYSLNEIQTAFAQRDVDTLHKYVDFKALLPPNYNILTDDIFNNDKIYGQKEHAVYKDFYALIEPILTDGTIASIDRYVQTGSWQKFSTDSMLQGRQLGIDYTELVNRSLLFNTDFKAIKSITQEDDDNASAVLAVADKYTATDFDLQIHLQRQDGIWRVTSVDNYKDYLEKISAIYQSDIKTYLAATQNDLDSSNARFAQLQSEFTVLAEKLYAGPSASQRILLKSFILQKIIPAYQDWYNYLASSQIPLGARHLHELRLDSASSSIQSWQKYADGISQDDVTKLNEAATLHEHAMETEQKVKDTINNMPALFMPEVE